LASTPEADATVTVQKEVIKRRGVIRSFFASWFKSEAKRKKDQRQRSVTENLEPKMMLSATSGVDTDVNEESAPRTLLIPNSTLQTSNNAHSDVTSKLAPEDMSLYDDFSSEDIDEDKWSVQLASRHNNPSVKQENGKLNIAGKSILVTKSEFVPSAENVITVEGEWTPTGEDMKMLYVNTRSSGEVDQAWGNATDGMQFSANTMGLMRIKDLGLNKTIGTMSLNVELGKTYTFHIEDNGSELYFRMNDANGRLIAGVKTDSTTQSDKGHIVLSDFGSRGYSSYDNIAIAGTPKEVVPEVDDPSSDPDVAEPISSDPQPTYEEMQEHINELKAAILERGMDARVLEQSFLETFDTWDAEKMETIWGDASVSNGKLYVGAASMVQLKETPIRKPGQEKITTIHVEVGGDRFMWRSGATQENEYAGQAVDIIANKYVGMTGPQGDSHPHAYYVNGVYTIVETENDDGIKLVITDPNGKQYNFSYGLHEAGTEAQPTLYSGRGSYIEDITFEVYSSQTLIEELGEAKIDLWSSDRDRAKEERMQEAFTVPGAQSLQERKAYLQDQINNLTLWQMSIETQIGREDVLIVQAAEMRAEAEDIMQRMEQQMGLESQQVIPFIEVKTFSLRPSFDIRYTDMPEGYSLKMDERGSDFHFDISAGSNSISADMPHFGWWGECSIYLVNSDGERIAELWHFGHTEASSPDRTGEGSGGGRIPQIAYVPELAPELRVSDEEITRGEALFIESDARHTDATARRESFLAERSDIQERINTLERQKVPISAMHVSPSIDNQFAVRYMSNRPQTYFEVSMPGGGTIRQTIDHPGGEPNGIIDFSVGTISNVNNGYGNSVDIYMYSDESKTEVLDHFRGNATQEGLRGETNANWDEMQQGYPIYKTGSGEVLETPLRMQTWNTNDVVSDLSVDATTAVTEYLFTGTLSSLDFSSMGGSAASLFANVQIEGDSPVTARFFRGGKEIGSQVLNGEDQLLFDDVDGFSAVIFESATPVTFGLSNVNYTLNDGFDFEVSELSGAENRIIANAIKQDWGIVKDIFTSPRYDRFLNQNHIIQYRANGMGGPSAGAYFLLGGAGDSFSQYTLFTPSSVASSPSLGKVVYYNDDGLFNLSPEFYTLVNSTLIVHVGAPTHIAVQIASGQNVLVRNAATADDLDDLLQRAEDFDPQIVVQKLYMGHHPDPGFHNGITEIQDGETPVLASGNQFYALLTVNNDTGISDTVSIDAYIGSTNTDDRSFVGTYTVAMGAYQSYTLIVNATAPSLNGGTPELIFEVNGTLVAGKHGKKARASEAEVQARRQGFADRIDNLMVEQHGEDSAQRLAFRTNAEETLGVTFDPIIVSGGGSGDNDEGNEDEEEEGNEDGEGGSENPDTTVNSETAFEEGIFQTIQDRVNARLAERLSAMTITERAEARGLLRRKEDGTLDEYFRKIFTNNITEEALNSIVDDSTIEITKESLEEYKRQLEYSKENFSKEVTRLKTQMVDIENSLINSENISTAIGMVINIPKSITTLAVNANSINNTADLMRIFGWEVVGSNIVDVSGEALESSDFFEVDADDSVAFAWVKVSAEALLNYSDPGYYLEHLVFHSWKDQIGYALNFLNEVAPKRLEQYDRWIDSAQEIIDNL